MENLFSHIEMLRFVFDAADRLTLCLQQKKAWHWLPAIRRFDNLSISSILSSTQLPGFVQMSLDWGALVTTPPDSHRDYPHIHPPHPLGRSVCGRQPGIGAASQYHPDQNATLNFAVHKEELGHRWIGTGRNRKRIGEMR